MEKPKVSIIIPTYNSGKLLFDCLKSIEDQTYSSCEVIVVDSFSSDCTLETANRFGAKTIRQKCNPALARNIGVDVSTGKYVFFVDSDQVLSPSVVEECVKKCMNENVGMVKIPEVFIGEGFWSRCSAALKNGYGKIDRLYASSEDVIHGEPRFFVKEQLIRCGVIDTTLLWGENYDLYQRLRKKGVGEGLCKSGIYHYELTSLGKILSKNVLYGRSMPAFVRQTNKQIFPILFRQALLAFSEACRDSRSSPGETVGSAFLLFLKAYSTALGLLVS